MNMNVYQNSRVTSLKANTNGTFTASGYMFNDSNCNKKDSLYREIIFVNESDSSTTKAYRQLVTSKYNTYLNSNNTATQNGKYDLSYAFYDVTVNPNSIQNYKKTSKGAMAKGSYLVYMRISDGKTSYLFPLRDLTLSDGTNMENTGTLPSGFEVIDQKTRELRYIVNKSSSTTTSSKTGLITKALNISSGNSHPANAFQDMRQWSYDKAVTKDTPDSKKEHSYIDYDVSRETVEAYVEMLQNNGFKLVQDYEISYKGETILRWAFLSQNSPNIPTFKSSYSDGVDCHMVIWSVEDDEYTLQYTNELEMMDLGLRIDGKSSDAGPQGISANAGLYRLANGSYQTSDKRLTTKVGQAMVIRDGKSYTGDVRYEIDKEDEELWIENYYKTEGMYFEVDQYSLKTNDILRIKDVERERYYTDEKNGIYSYNWNTPMFMMSYNDIWGGPTTINSVFEDLTIRVMHYEENGDAVYYIYAKLKGVTPSEVEVLCAVNTKNATKKDDNKDTGSSYEDESVTMNKGETITLKDSRNKFGSDYHVYDWTVEKGANLVEISSVGNKCTIKAKGKGEVVISSKYSYTKDEPDVLTGITRPSHKSETKRFYITIK